MYIYIYRINLIALCDIGDNVAWNKGDNGHLFRASDERYTLRAIRTTKGIRYNFMGTIYFVGHYFYRDK